MADPERRARVSARLKAARQLGGQPVGTRVVPLPVPELARFPTLVENGVTKNRLEDIEQMKVDARPYELREISTALRLPAGWWGENVGESIDDVNVSVANFLQGVAEAVQAHRQASAEGDAAPGARGRRRRAGGGGGG
jgi:hypothetical protein